VTKKGVVLRIPTDRAKKYKADVKEICGEITPFIGDVGATVKVYRPRRVGDLDGVFMAVFDAITGHAFKDDKQIVEIHAFRFEDPKRPRIELEITPHGLC
jgi:Holliday junction resolvase RusA-like endonuclease